MAIFKHVSRLEVAQIYPDQLLANTGDLAHLFHDLGYQVSPLIFSSASPYIGSDPDVTCRKMAAEETIDGLIFVDNDLDEKLRCAGILTVKASDCSRD